MPGTKYSMKQMKIARVAEPRNKITGADFTALKKGKRKRKSMMATKRRMA
tara:strand:- start:876 stop:1025 length:150 start_codon:yes stop_codon:yes gene_type:complete